MENRSFKHEDRNESSAFYRDRTAATVGNRQAPGGDEFGGSLNREELRALIDFFELLDRWDRQNQEVVQ
jgi:hypothetical protein